MGKYSNVPHSVLHQKKLIFLYSKSSSGLNCSTVLKSIIPTKLSSPMQCLLAGFSMGTQQCIEGQPAKGQQSWKWWQWHHLTRSLLVFPSLVDPIRMGHSALQKRPREEQPQLESHSKKQECWLSSHLIGQQSLPAQSPHAWDSQQPA